MTLCTTRVACLHWQHLRKKEACLWPGRVSCEDTGSDGIKEALSTRYMSADVFARAPHQTPIPPARVSCLLDQMGRQRDRDIHKAVLDCLHTHRTGTSDPQPAGAGFSTADVASYQAWLTSPETHSLSRLLTLGFILNNRVVLLSLEDDQAELQGSLAESRLAYSLRGTPELAQMSPLCEITPENLSREGSPELSAFERELEALSMCDSPK